MYIPTYEFAGSASNISNNHTNDYSDLRFLTGIAKYYCDTLGPVRKLVSFVALYILLAYHNYIYTYCKMDMCFKGLNSLIVINNNEFTIPSEL
jgi:hypothetical protein